ncbi:NusG domain II-containing protein [Paenibacillus sp.]|jgi:hypothetical protein|uniref:NusG domain II-containing protein n=1 Tax=Paenibacillus sp. TaxID=58172 RepID=UPI00281E6390|nr:NusG domain II-containing protein [Paenibacillus sp.]MDR0269193.1 NusG domain II-containing protein [Paenibacillus sp.]
MKRGDLLLISAILIVAVLLMVPRWVQNSNDSEKNHNDMKAVIKVDGKVYQTVALTQEEQMIEVPSDHGHNVLKIHDHGIEMIDADCPDQVCLSFGFKTRNGDTIVCLPHRVIVEIEGDGGEGEGTDAVI